MSRWYTCHASVSHPYIISVILCGVDMETSLSILVVFLRNCLDCISSSDGLSKEQPKPCIVIKLHEIKRFIRKFWLIKVLMDQYNTRVMGPWIPFSQHVRITYILAQKCSIEMTYV